MTRAPTRTCNNEHSVNPPTDIGWLIVTSSNRLFAEADKQLAPLGLTAAQGSVVVLLARDNVSTPTELCNMMDYDRGAMTRLLNRMEAKGILKRLPNPTDRRAQVLELTTKGEQLYDQLLPTIDQVHAKALAGLDSEQAKTLATLLYRVATNLE